MDRRGRADKSGVFKLTEKAASGLITADSPIRAHFPAEDNLKIQTKLKMLPLRSIKGLTVTGCRADNREKTRALGRRRRVFRAAVAASPQRAARPAEAADPGGGRGAAVT